MRGELRARKAMQALGREGCLPVEDRGSFQKCGCQHWLRHRLYPSSQAVAGWPPQECLRVKDVRGKKTWKEDKGSRTHTHALLQSRLASHVTTVRGYQTPILAKHLTLIRIHHYINPVRNITIKGADDNCQLISNLNWLH